MTTIDPESSDAGPEELDLTPRRLDDRPRGRKLGPIIVIALVVGVIGFALYQGLAGASLSLNDANDAVAERDDLGDRRFRLLGTPIAITSEDYIVDNNTAVLFTVACDGVTVDVVHRGNVAEAFQMGIPVVLEGSWADTATAGLTTFESGANDGYYFNSNRMLVKHDNDYRTDRIEEASSCGGDLVDAPAGVDAPAS